MSILKFIERVCVQPAIYWGAPVPDGYGTFLFPDPIQVMVRWDEKATIILDNTGKEVLSKAQILCPNELQVGGMIMLGYLSGIVKEIESPTPTATPTPAPVVEYKSPYEVNEEVILAMEIMSRNVTPLFRSKDKFVYTYFLSPRNQI